MECKEFQRRLVSILVSRRKQFGYSQESIAKMMGKNQVTIYNFEKCRNKLLIETAWIYCQLLEITFDKVVTLALQDWKQDDAIDMTYKDITYVLQNLDPPHANKLAKAIRDILPFHMEREKNRRKVIKTEAQAKNELETKRLKQEQSLVKKRPGRPRKKSYR